MLKIMGKSQASIEQMRAYIRKMNPKVFNSVIKIIPLYIRTELSGDRELHFQRIRGDTGSE